MRTLIMNVRTCDKLGKHKNRPIEALCLEDGCKKNRLLCFFCIFEAHKSHHIAHLHKELDGPISALQTYLSQRQSKIEDKDYFEKNFTKVIKVVKQCIQSWQKISKNVTTSVAIIKKHILPQFQAIKKTFKPSSAQDIIKDLTSNHHIQPQRIERYAQMLKVFNKDIFEDIQLLKKNAQIMEIRLDKIFNCAQEKITDILNGVIKEVLKFNIISCHLNEEGDPMENEQQQKMVQKQEHAEYCKDQLLDNKKQQSINCEKENRDYNQLRRTEKRKFNHNLNCNNQVNFTWNNLIQISHQLNPQQNLHQINIMDEKEAQHSNIFQKMMEQPLKVVPLLNSGQIQIEKINKYNNMDENSMQEQLNQQSWQPTQRQMTKIQLGSQTIKRPQRSHLTDLSNVELVKITGPNPYQINLLLSNLQPDNVQKLIIICDTQLCALNQESIKIISKMDNLVSLRVHLARGLNDQLVIELLSHLPSLKQLCLSQFDNVTQSLVTFIVQHCKNIQSLFFLLDTANDIPQMQSMLQFLPDFPNCKVPEQLMEQLSLGLSSLKNLQLCDVTNFPFWIKMIKQNKDKLKQITIMNLQNQQRLDYTSIFQALKECSNLQAIRLQMLQFDEKVLCEVLKCNKLLKSFVIGECSVTNITFNFLTKYNIRLKHLYVFLDDKFAGKGICNLKQLQTLIIRGCFELKVTILANSICKLKHLTCFSYNLNDQNSMRKIMASIHSLRKINTININSSGLDTIGLKYLQNLDKLTTLVCHNNNFNLEGIITMKFNKHIKGLSVSKNMLDKVNSHQNIDLAKLAKKFPYLTHLKLQGFKNIRAKDCALFSKLTSLTIVNGIREQLNEINGYCYSRHIQFNVIQK